MGLLTVISTFLLTISSATPPRICPNPNNVLVTRKAAAQFVPSQVWVGPAQYCSVRVRMPVTSRVTAADKFPDLLFELADV